MLFMIHAQNSIRFVGIDISVHLQFVLSGSIV